jgi:hypothetical protein
MFNVGDTAYFAGSNEKVTITKVQVKPTGGRYYSVSDSPATIPARMLWSGFGNSVAFCTYLSCQRKIQLQNEIEGTDYIKDKYGFYSCVHHEPIDWDNGNA